MLFANEVESIFLFLSHPPQQASNIKALALDLMDCIYTVYNYSIISQEEEVIYGTAKKSTNQCNGYGLLSLYLSLCSASLFMR